MVRDRESKKDDGRKAEKRRGPSVGERKVSGTRGLCGLVDEFR